MQLALAVRCIRQCAGIMFTLGEQVALSASNTMLHRSRNCEMNSLLPREILRLFDQQHIIYWTVTVKSSSISSIKILIFGSIHCTIHSARRKKKLSSSIIEITIHEIRVYFFISSVFLLSRITRITIAKNSMNERKKYVKKRVSSSVEITRRTEYATVPHATRAVLRLKGTGRVCRCVKSA